MGEELNSLSLIDLRELAKQKGIKATSKLNKDALIQAIMEEHNAVKNEVNNNDSIVEEEFKKSLAEPSQSGDYSAEGVLEVLPDGFGFLRGENYLSTPKDIYVSPIQIKRFKLATGDKIQGIARMPRETEKFSALIYENTINGDLPEIS